MYIIVDIQEIYHLFIVQTFAFFYDIGRFEIETSIKQLELGS